MVKSHERSPDAADAGLVKRLKTAAAGSTAVEDDVEARFYDGVLAHTTIARMNNMYRNSQPFHYALVDKLFQDDLLKRVKDECMSELSFSEKETDIYKVKQTGDLASLNYLTPDQISLLPNLLALRNALYSPKFRSFIRSATGCGPLSGSKQDMSVNSYTKGCHLLNHDDVIGSRRVSYILYMPIPNYQLWQPEWGGALELYPVKETATGQLEPEPVPFRTIPPSWNQFIFFEVQPGRSFHSVEEVVVGGEGEDGRERLSISGWFHAAQEGEEGYTPELASDIKSSREQLTSTHTEFKTYPEESATPMPDTQLADEHVAFLSEFLNPVYLQPRTMNALAGRFVEESSLELHSFLKEALASSLEPRLRELDARDGLGPERGGRVPSHACGTGEGSAWQLRGPPHKWRYCQLKPHTPGAVAEAVTPRAAARTSDEIVRSLQDELFPSPAFRAWLAVVSRLLPLRHAVEARRFRPGMDYTLATSEEREARLDVVLGLTPQVTASEDDGRSADSRGWQVAEWGGWECYMAPHNEEDDPAVYRSSIHKKSRGGKPNADAEDADADTEHDEDEETLTSGENGEGATGKEADGKEANGEVTNGAATNGHAPTVETDGEEDGVAPEASMDVDEEEEDSTLLTVQPGFNRLLLVLRDERVMRFVKYVSAAAEGSRWDVCGEYEVGVMQEEEEEEEEDLATEA
ncbi:Oxoglutarate and iron-dependent oxygenase degradation C-term-domain-containing protein [Schizophyllum amplum]|uniref:uS12 prolyl 3,4-dihydroxylase n=1 Tax=Schizophyllum amplum TaxID=97359 RepID=A0A550CSW9_9AGAR|nr:Oxoglutarate and iron-dependent oxygenase degradation C-term-domain-containing protein [Auriculariopsis ampla]